MELNEQIFNLVNNTTYKSNVISTTYSVADENTDDDITFISSCVININAVFTGCGTSKEEAQIKLIDNVNSFLENNNEKRFYGRNYFKTFDVKKIDFEKYVDIWILDGSNFEEKIIFKNDLYIICLTEKNDFYDILQKTQENVYVIQAHKKHIEQTISFIEGQISIKAPHKKVYTNLG